METKDIIFSSYKTLNKNIDFYELFNKENLKLLLTKEDLKENLNVESFNELLNSYINKEETICLKLNKLIYNKTNVINIVSLDEFKKLYEINNSNFDLLISNDDLIINIIKNPSRLFEILSINKDKYNAYIYNDDSSYLILKSK